MNYEILYTYIKAVILEQEEYYMDVVDTLRYNTSDFFSQIKTNLALKNDSEEDLSITNLFCIVSQKEKIQEIEKTIAQEIIHRITLGETFENTYQSKDLLTQYLNTFTHYLFKESLAPLIFKLELEDISILYLFGSPEFYEQPPAEILGILYAWCEKEKPILFGKQIMTAPFYYKSLIGRKSIDIIPSRTDDNLYLLLEGNIKIKLDYDAISTFNYLDTTHFNVNDVKDILYNPIYCFGYTFEPFILFLEWFDIYLYTMALLDVNLKDLALLKLSYTTFLDFIEKHVCEKVYADKSILEEDCFYSCLQLHIKNISNFLKRNRRMEYF